MGIDLWRTINVWLDATPSEGVDEALLILVTTAIAIPESGTALLRPESRDVPQAQTLIELAARNSMAVETAAFRERFLSLTSAERTALLSRVRVLDGAPHVIDIDAAVRRQLKWAISRGREGLFMEMLWGWWNLEALTMLTGRRGPIGVGEVHERITGIRDQFTSDNLPTLLHLADIDRDEVALLLGDRTFVAQLRLIDWPEQNLQIAVIDYYRAFVHSTRWVDDDLIGLSELLKFGLELVDEWKSEFEFMQRDLADNATEADCKSAGVALLRKLLGSSTIKVRPRYDEAYFARGKRHELADQMQIGWHPNYVSALSVEVSP
jgi:hypothetical protein